MRLTLLFSWLLVSVSSFGQHGNSVTGAIEKITVFREAAQVERSVNVLVSGKKEITITGLSNSIDSQSIQVKAPPSVQILSVHQRKNYLHKKEKELTIETVELRTDSLQEAIQKDSSMLLILNEQLAMLRKNQTLASSEAGNVEKLSAALEFQRNRMEQIFTSIGKYERNLESYRKQRIDAENQLSELNGANEEPVTEIVVLLQSPASQQVKLHITYLVAEAGWYPEYDIRVKSIAEPLELQMKAQVFQQSGEKWENVNMYLSTGNPSDKADKPFVKPWYLNFSQPSAFTQRVRVDNQLPPRPDAVSGRIMTAQGAPVSFATVTIKGTKTATTTDASGYFSLPVTAYQVNLQVSAVGFETVELMANRGARLRVSVNESATMLQEVVVVGYSSSGNSDDGWPASRIEKEKDDFPVDTRVSYAPTTVEYQIIEPFTLPGDGKSYITSIASFEIAAAYNYYVAPRLEEAAYLQASITGWEEYNLLPGASNLYFEGTYLGTSYLDVLNQSDTLTISLGQDRNIIVQRKLLKENAERRFLGTTKLEQRSYEIVITNRKQEPVSVTVQEQFPIAVRKEIEVKNKRYSDAILDEGTQIISWKKTIAPKEQESMKFSFEVRYPGRYWLNVDQPL